MNTSPFPEEVVPVSQRRERVVKAPIAAVWRELRAIERWPEWVPELSDLRHEGPIDVGSQLTYRNGGTRLAVRLLELTPERSLCFEGRAFGVIGVNRWTLEPVAEGTRVAVEERMRGLIARVLRGPFNNKLGLSLEAWLQALEARVARGGVAKAS
ncbi:MAG: SRPBCC family protein [Myxococcaceae bacterium]|nr:SRPBCC family protein [Myxococcaceae bacterium]